MGVGPHWCWTTSRYVYYVLYALRWEASAGSPLEQVNWGKSKTDLESIELTARRADRLTDVVDVMTQLSLEGVEKPVQFGRKALRDQMNLAAAEIPNVPGHGIRRRNPPRGVAESDSLHRSLVVDFPLFALVVRHDIPIIQNLQYSADGSRFPVVPSGNRKTATRGERLASPFTLDPRRPISYPPLSPKLYRFRADTTPSRSPGSQAPAWEPTFARC